MKSRNIELLGLMGIDVSWYKENPFVSSSSMILHDLKLEAENCHKCDLYETRKNVVFGKGDEKSKILIIGEAPGQDEDKTGEPFVGRAGNLLDKMLAAIGLDRKKVYISNIVNYRPPDNRRPTDEEIKRYLPFITKHIEIINPKIRDAEQKRRKNMEYDDEIPF